MHPELNELLEYTEGTLAGPRRRELKRHLKRCAACRQEILQLRLAEMSDPDERAPEADGVVARIREWELQREDPGSAAVRERVATEIAPFLGKGTSARMVGTDAENGPGVLSRVEPVLELFLGLRAARSLVNTVVNRAIMRI